MCRTEYYRSFSRMHQSFDLLQLEIVDHDLFVASIEESFHYTHEEVDLGHGEVTEYSLKNLVGQLVDLFFHLIMVK